ncbi:MAG: type III secretion protein [Oscillospiraceae bacterium]|jgi:flagellar biosynthesis protein|nr:type III secretion protein [Oscillospiraceae bacterium]
MSRRDRSRDASGRAVALRYDGGGAPVVVASGMGYLAEKIVEVASESGVPVYEDTSLATMLSQLSLGQEIPDSLYRAIVEIYVYFLNFDPADPDKARRERQAMKEAAIAAAQAEEAEARAAAAAVEAAEKGES